MSGTKSERQGRKETKRRESKKDVSALKREERYMRKFEGDLPKTHEK